jgi:hypothetical protein
MAYWANTSGRGGAAVEGRVAASWAGCCAERLAGRPAPLPAAGRSSPPLMLPPLPPDTHTPRPPPHPNATHPPARLPAQEAGPLADLAAAVGARAGARRGAGAVPDDSRLPGRGRRRGLQVRAVAGQGCCCRLPCMPPATTRLATLPTELKPRLSPTQKGGRAVPVERGFLGPAGHTLAQLLGGGLLLRAGCRGPGGRPGLAAAGTCRVHEAWEGLHHEAAVPQPATDCPRLPCRPPRRSWRTTHASTAPRAPSAQRPRSPERLCAQGRSAHAPFARGAQQPGPV